MSTAMTEMCFSKDKIISGPGRRGENPQKWLKYFEIRILKIRFICSVSCAFLCPFKIIKVTQEKSTAPCWLFCWFSTFTQATGFVQSAACSERRTDFWHFSWHLQPFRGVGKNVLESSIFSKIENFDRSESFSHGSCGQ